MNENFSNYVVEKLEENFEEEYNAECIIDVWESSIVVQQNKTTWIRCVRCDKWLHEGYSKEIIIFSVV